MSISQINRLMADWRVAEGAAAHAQFSIAQVGPEERAPAELLVMARLLEEHARMRLAAAMAMAETRRLMSEPRDSRNDVRRQEYSAA